MLCLNVERVFNFHELGTRVIKPKSLPQLDYTRNDVDGKNAQDCVVYIRGPHDSKQILFTNLDAFLRIIFQGESSTVTKLY